MVSLPGISHQRAVKAFERAGYMVVREGKHIVMTNGERIITVPRHDPVNGFTMAGIVKDAGLTNPAPLSHGYPSSCFRSYWL